MQLLLKIPSPELQCLLRVITNQHFRALILLRNGRMYTFTAHTYIHANTLTPTPHTQLRATVLRQRCHPHLLVQVLLHARGLEDVFFDTVDGAEAEDAHLIGLSDAVGAVLGLCIHRRVPIAVEDDDLRVRGRWRRIVGIHPGDSAV